MILSFSILYINVHIIYIDVVWIWGSEKGEGDMSTFSCELKKCQHIGLTTFNLTPFIIRKNINNGSLIKQVKKEIQYSITQ